jgi:hypothetical protein
MEIKKKISLVKKNTDEFIDQIDRIGKDQNLGLSKFLLISCLIDTVSTYAYHKMRNNQQYKKFITDYLGQVNEKYKKGKIAEQIYQGIRCSLVHSFTISKNILLTEASDRNIHLEKNINNHLIVDLTSFFDDIKEAIKIFFKDLNKGNGDIHKIFKKTFNDNPPFKVYKRVDLLDPNQPVTGTVELNTISYDKINFRRSHSS